MLIMGPGGIGAIGAPYITGGQDGQLP